MAAVKALLVAPAALRSLAVSKDEREFIVAQLNSLRRTALRSGSLGAERVCLEGMMNLSLIDLTDRMRLAYIWSQDKGLAPKFAVASVFAEFLARSNSSSVAYEGYNDVKSALDRQLKNNPRWIHLLQLQRELRSASILPK